MTFRWWMAPVIGVGTVACANAVLIFTAVKVRPQKVEDRPYTASAHEDARAGERAAFAERGWRLESAFEAGAAVLTLHAPGSPRPVAGVVQVYRPDDRASDRELRWADPTQPLRCELPRHGAWDLRVSISDESGTILAHAVRLQRP